MDTRALVSGGVLICWCACALVGPELTISPNQIDLDRILMPPGAGGLLGYDDLGRSVGERLLIGARTALVIGISVVVCAGMLGTLCGLVAAWFGGWVDQCLLRIMDVVLAFPGILPAIALAGTLGPGLDNLVFALVAVGWVGYARLARAQALSIRQREHVQAARVLGCADYRILWRHILPLSWAPLIVEATFGLGAAIVAEAGLSFLGLGVQPPAASWGSMIRSGAEYMLVAPHLVVVPGVAMVMVVMSVNLLGDWVRDRQQVTRRPVGLRPAVGA